jgi:hypothetical protein
VGDAILASIHALRIRWPWTWNQILGHCGIEFEESDEEMVVSRDSPSALANGYVTELLDENRLNSLPPLSDDMGSLS